MDNSRNNKPIYKRWSTWVIAIIIVGILGNLLPSNDADNSAIETPAKVEAEAEAPSDKAEAIAIDEEETPSTPEPEQAPAEQLSLADAVNDYLGDRRILGQGVKDGYYTIETDFGDIVSRERCEEESVDLAQIVSEHPDYAATGSNGVKVVYISGVTDVYGNSADDTVMYVTYANETIAQINFDNFDTDNVVDVSDDYFRMASFK